MSKHKLSIVDLVGKDGRWKPPSECTPEEKDRIKEYLRDGLSFQQKTEAQRMKEESLRFDPEKVLNYRKSIRDLLSDVIIKSGGREVLTRWETLRMFIVGFILPKGFVIEFAEPEVESVDGLKLRSILSEMWADKIASTPENLHAATCTTTLQVEELDAQGKIVINPDELTVVEAEIVRRGLDPEHSIAKEN